MNYVLLDFVNTIILNVQHFCTKLLVELLRAEKYKYIYSTELLMLKLKLHINSPNIAMLHLTSSYIASYLHYNQGPLGPYS